jgi:hypothetical protein
MVELACNYNPLASIPCDPDCCDYEGCYEVIYVDGDFESSNPNGSLANPYSTIQEGIDNAVAGDTIYVAPATFPYEESILITKNVKLYSYYQLNQEESDSLNYLTIINTIIDCEPILIDGNMKSCITVAAHDFEDVDTGFPEIVGFTIKNGAGTLVTHAASGDSYYVGGGMFIDHSFPVVQHNRFIDNGSGEEIIDAGGGIYGFYGGGISMRAGILP